MHTVCLYLPTINYVLFLIKFVKAFEYSVRDDKRTDYIDKLLNAKTIPRTTKSK